MFNPRSRRRPSSSVPPDGDPARPVDPPPATPRLVVNGTCRADVVPAAAPLRFSLWQPTDDPARWRVDRWSVATHSPCVHCRYSLRGLPFDGRCPECGRSTADSVRLRFELARGRTPAEVTANRERFARWDRVAVETGADRGAVRVVRDAVAFGSSTFRHLGVARDLRAADVAAALADFAPLHFGTVDKAAVALAGLHLTRGEDVGRIVYGLVDHRLLSAAADDRPEDFAGLFTLATLFDGRWPDGHDAAPPSRRATPMSDDANFVLQHDAACDGCRHNVRGLRASGHCPECGQPVLAAAASDPDERDRLARLRRGAAFADVVRDSGCSLDAVLLVADVLRTARPPPGLLGLLGLGRRPRPLSAADVADAFRLFCGRYFNDADEARDLLAEWHLSTSEDLGRVVAALAAAGMAAAVADDRADHYAGLFTLDTLFA